MSREITIWTSEPDYGDYRQIMEEDFPQLPESERKEILKSANEACLEFQRQEMSADLGGPIVVLSEYSGEGRSDSVCSILPSKDLADCFIRPAGGFPIRWFVDEAGDLRSEEKRDGVTVRRLYRVMSDRNLRLGDALSRVYGFPSPWQGR
ncbi:MAG: hypothetical protein IJM17_02405 [Firmicutes bacterium]|nr:hypothetical protein [Bacillota bacterium]